MEDDNIDNDCGSLDLKESESDLEFIEKSCISFEYNGEIYIVLYLWLRRSQGRNCMCR